MSTIPSKGNAFDLYTNKIMFRSRSRSIERKKEKKDSLEDRFLKYLSNNSNLTNTYKSQELPKISQNGKDYYISIKESQNQSELQAYLKDLRCMPLEESFEKEKTYEKDETNGFFFKKLIIEDQKCAEIKKDI